MNALLNQVLFAGHPLLEKLFILAGGMSLMVHLVTEGWPRLIAAVMAIGLSSNHPAVREALIDNETALLNGVEAAKIQMQASIDAAKAQNASVAPIKQ